VTAPRAVERLTTARLRAEPVTGAHLELLVEMWADERVTATLGGPRGRANVELMVACYETEWARRGYGEWAWFDLTGAFVGRAGLRHVEVEGRPEVEIGYAIVADRWGEGLATEITREIGRVAFEDVRLPDPPGVVAFTLPTNIGSQRVMQKAGLVYERDIVWADLPHVLYRLGSAVTTTPA
jgi:RimJ/RimL family protein N-acetyltransferase